MVLIKSKLFLFLILVIAVSFTTGCSSSSSSNTEGEELPRTVTREESQLLARVLNENHLAKNATFVATSGDVASEGFVANGIADWDNSVVSLDVALRDPKTIDLSSISTTEIVYEKYPLLGSLFSSGGAGNPEWVAREFDATKYGIDALALFVIKLASQAPDNPLLVRQDGAQYLGTDKVQGEDVVKLKSPGGITFYIASDGVAKKVVAPIKGFANEVTFSISALGESEVRLPDPASTVSIEEIRALYFENRPKF